MRTHCPLSLSQTHKHTHTPPLEHNQIFQIGWDQVMNQDRYSMLQAPGDKVNRSVYQWQTGRKYSWPTHRSIIRPTGRQTKWGTGWERQKLATADGSNHDAASKYRWVEKSKRQSYTSDLMQPCEPSAADRKTVNREAIDRNMAQYVRVSACGVCDWGRTSVYLPVYVCVCACSWTQRRTVKYQTNATFYTWFMQAAEIQIFCHSNDLQDLALTSTCLEK